MTREEIGQILCCFRMSTPGNVYKRHSHTVKMYLTVRCPAAASRYQKLNVAICRFFIKKTKYLKGWLSGILNSFQLWLLNWITAFCECILDSARGFGSHYDEYWFTSPITFASTIPHKPFEYECAFIMIHWGMNCAQRARGTERDTATLACENRIIQLVNLQSHIFYGKHSIMLHIRNVFYSIFFCLTIARNEEKKRIMELACNVVNGVRMFFFIFLRGVRGAFQFLAIWVDEQRISLSLGLLTDNLYFVKSHLCGELPQSSALLFISSIHTVCTQHLI